MWSGDMYISLWLWFRLIMFLFNKQNGIYTSTALILLLPMLLACERESVTTDKTDNAVVVRSNEQTAPDPTPTSTPDPTSTPRPSKPPDPTTPPQPRILFPPELDGAVLNALYDAAGGDGWSNNDGWLYNEDLGLWQGVTTNAEGRVTRLDLSDNQLEWRNTPRDRQPQQPGMAGPQR